jgi:hypothetical protein
MKIMIKSMWLVLLILCCNVAYSFENVSVHQKAEIMSRFNGIQTPLIEQVVTNEQGVFLLVNDFWVCSKSMQASEEGTFVLVNGEWMSLLAAIENGDCIRASWKCSKCGRFNMDGVNACPYCGKPKNG